MREQGGCMSGNLADNLRPATRWDVRRWDKRVELEFRPREDEQILDFTHEMAIVLFEVEALEWNVEL